MFTPLRVAFLVKSSELESLSRPGSAIRWPSILNIRKDGHAQVLDNFFPIREETWKPKES
jgi:hypothetical protein